MRTKTKGLIIFLLLVRFICLNAEIKPAIEHLTANNGLSHNTIRCMLQDKTGFMWFGSLNGLNRYDGSVMKSIIPDSKNPNSLLSGKIKELHEDKRGYIWLRTYSDIFQCYNPEKENFIQIYKDRNEHFKRKFLYYEDLDGNIWLGSGNEGCTRFNFDNNGVNSIKFDSKSVNYKLISDNVTDILGDSKKNVWILTENGFNVFSNNTISSEFKSIPGNYFKAYELNNKIYLITLDAKILVYNPANHKFESKTNLANDKVIQTTLFNNLIAISTAKSGLLFFNTINKAIISSEQIFGEKLSGEMHFRKNKSNDILTYNFSGNIWFWQHKTGKTFKLNLTPKTILHLIDEERYESLYDQSGNLWISTFGNGLFCYNIENETLSHYSSNIENKYRIASNYILALELDKNGNIWIGTENAGIHKLSFANRNVQLYLPDPNQTIHNGNVVRSFLEDYNGNIWVSTRAGNMYIYDNKLQNPKKVYDNKYNVYSMFEDKNHEIWLGTKKDGLIELKNGKLSGAVQYINNGTGSLAHNSVFSTVMDRKGRVWAATFGGGLCVKTGESPNSFKVFFDLDNWVRFARYVFLDSKGDIWSSTTNGVYRFNPDELLANPKAFRYYSFSPETADCLSNPEVRYIFEDSKGNIWLATSGGGLNKFEGETPDGNGKFKTYSNKKRIAYDNVMAILEDNAGYIWLSTENGLHKLNPETGTFQHYRFFDDFSSNLFSETAALKCKDGRMLWGSMNGFYAFDPLKIGQSSKVQSKVFLTGFSIFDEPAIIAERNAPLKKSITFSDKIVLASSDKVFHIEFSDLNYGNPMENQYMYMLENYEKRWNIVSNSNSATYRNVPYGSYTFLVKSMNSDGNWSENVTSIEIEIQPPFWLSKPALLIYFILLVFAIYTAFKLIKKFNDLNNAVALERELTNYKLRFFTNISHEFRTPLTLIKGSVDTLVELKNKMSEPLQHLMDDLNKNTNHLMRLIDQLLEFRKLQNNKQKLNLRNTNLVVFTKDIFESFKNVADKMNIEYTFKPAFDVIELSLDQNKIDKIVFNLLSNAFKFTPRGGRISLNLDVDYETQMAIISVSDNGIGIPREKQELLFSRFMQINFSEKGTGIGLSLVNEFTVLHKGNVHYSENIGGGSIFTIELPLHNDLYDADDFISDDILVNTGETNEKVHISEFFSEKENENLLELLPVSPVKGTNYKILVIDDNDDIRNFLSEKLSAGFEVITAEDGEKGFQMSMENDPDLIICDVMMPGMNGFELTRKLKDDFATCHIPVVLLTAYTADEHELEGVKAGADAYISKPFSLKNLIIQINKLLEKKSKIHQHYSGNNTVKELIEDNKLDFPERDTSFLTMIEEILEKNLTDAEFNVDDFAAMAKTGRTLFFKKVKFLTGYSPNELIRVRRMTKAADLLKSHSYNVSEVSYMVGINDPFYFSKCFKAQFGCSPSQYIHKQ